MFSVSPVYGFNNWEILTLPVVYVIFYIFVNG